MTGQAWVSWSSGKDSALALHIVREHGDLDVTGLLVTVHEDSERVTAHGVPRGLVAAQAERLGLPVHVVTMPEQSSNADYERRMTRAFERALAVGVDHLVFGDLHLADIRRYRERLLAGSGLRPLFPLWGEPTGPLATRVLDTGIEALLTCVDLAQLPPRYAGRTYDEHLLADLPPGADPCGENGEFHTFVTNGPGFAAPVALARGDVVERGGFAYCDVLPAVP